MNEKCWQWHLSDRKGKHMGTGCATGICLWDCTGVKETGCRGWTGCICLGVCTGVVSTVRSDWRWGDWGAWRHCIGRTCGILLSGVTTWFVRRCGCGTSGPSGLWRGPWATWGIWGVGGLCAGNMGRCLLGVSSRGGGDCNRGGCRNAATTGPCHLQNACTMLQCSNQKQEWHAETDGCKKTKKTVIESDWIWKVLIDASMFPYVSYVSLPFWSSLLCASPASAWILAPQTKAPGGGPEEIDPAGLPFRGVRGGCVQTNGLAGDGDRE